MAAIRRIIVVGGGLAVFKIDEAGAALDCPSIVTIKHGTRSHA